MEKNEKLLEFKFIPQQERYYNEESTYGVYTFLTEDEIPEFKEYDPSSLFEDDEEFGKSKKVLLKQSTVCGNMQQLYLGNEYLFTGVLDYSKKYESWQYKPKNITALKPQSTEHQRKFLESILSKNQANVLIETYPNIVNEVINGRTEIDYNKTKGIREYTWNNIKEKILDNYIISEILIMLQPIGVTYKMIKKLISNSGSVAELKTNLLENPYILTSIRGIGFKTIDRLALKLTPKLIDSSQRIYAFIKYYLAEEIGANIGHTWVEIEILKDAVRNNVHECIDLFDGIIETEKQTNMLLYIEDDKVGLAYYRRVEENILSILYELNNTEQHYENEFDIEKGIKESENEQGFKFTDEQLETIQTNIVSKNKVKIICGKAGSSKTTISRALLKIYANAGLSIGACALSAKASQRITEATGFKASTIHRMLGAVGLNKYMYTFDCPMPYDVILIDECSMINARLFYDLLSAIKLGAIVIMVGDNRQLPPIGFGNIFSDLISRTDLFQITELKKVMRQAEMSGILSDANLIRDGNSPLDRPELKTIHGELQDMYYMFRNSREHLQDIAIKTYMKTIKEFGLDETVIIVPRKQDCLNSTKQINIQIQDLLIDSKQPYVQYGYIKYKQGAKVIQRENNYDKNVFNGETGYINSIEKDGKHEVINIKYGENKIIPYTKKELSQIDFAYAMTVHLTQGSGYKVVIGIMDTTHYTLLDTCLLYTLLTRAKQRCLLLSEPKAFAMCMKKDKGIFRQTWLGDLSIDKITKNNIDLQTNEFDNEEVD